YRVSSTNAWGTSTGGDVSFTTPTQFAFWAANQGINPNAQPTDDSDGDGVSNFMEWAFGMNPGSNDTGTLTLSGNTVSRRGSPITPLATMPEGVDFRAAFCRRKDFATVGLTYTVQFSADLITWASSVETPSVIADDGEIEVVTVKYPFFVNGQKARFFRV